MTQPSGTFEQGPSKWDDQLIPRFVVPSMAHRQDETDQGYADDRCRECGHVWPCPTRLVEINQRIDEINREIGVLVVERADLGRKLDTSKGNGIGPAGVPVSEW